MLKDNITQEVRKMDLSGLFFAIGHAPATKFLKGQLELDDYGYIVTRPDSTATSVPGRQQGAQHQRRGAHMPVQALSSLSRAAVVVVVVARGLP